MAFLYSGILWFRFIVEVPPLWVGLDKWLVKVSCLELSSVFWWLELDLPSLECNEVSSSESWGVFGFGLALSSLPFNAQGYVPAVLENWHGMSCSGTGWLLGGACFQCSYGGFWMNSCQLVFPGIRSFLVFSSFGVKPPASDFQSYSYSSLKTFPSIHRW